MQSAAGDFGFVVNLPECALFLELLEPFLAHLPWEFGHYFFPYTFKFPKINLAVFRDNNMITRE